MNIRFLASLTLAAATSSPAGIAANSTLKVFGVPYQLPNRSTLPLNLGDDPIIGTLSCPSLTRLNLLTQRSEHPLLNQMKVETIGQKTTWSMQLRDGLRWWDGTNASHEDLAVFLREKLPELTKDQSLGKWDLPGFSIQLLDDAGIKISFEAPPAFGPHILDGVPFAKSTSPEGLAQCVGPYRFSKKNDAALLLETVSGGNTRFRNIELTSAPLEQTMAKDGVWMHFKHAAQFSGSPKGRASNQSIQCQRPLDLPVVTMVVWNPERPLVNNVRVRQTLTKLTPRGALLRLGAGRLGDLVSGPLLRAHPGYNSKVLVRPFDLSGASDDLEGYGLRRPTADQPRLGFNGEPMVIVLRTASNTAGLVEKAVGDALASVGIGVKFVAADTPKHQVDGFIASLALPWPDGNFLADLHSRANVEKSPLYSLKDQSLDTLLEEYALSLTTGQPNFRSLQRVHARVYALEPFTILMQHHTCVEAGEGLTSEIPPIIMRDPQWFYGLVM